MAETPRITLAMLKGACRDERAIFRKEWPEGVDVTLENVRRAQEIGLSLEWGRGWFTPEARKTYAEAIALADKAYHEAIAPARETYFEATAPAGKALDEAIATARKDYAEALALAGKAYDEAIAPARKTYFEAIAPARKAYHEAIALAWFLAFLDSQKEARNEIHLFG